MIAAWRVPQEEKKPKYIECEEAYPLAKKICDAIDSEDFQRLNFGMRILDWIDDIPAADAREVVLCRECKWCHSGYCEKYDDIIPFGCADMQWEDWFCADGERPNCGADMRQKEEADGT